MPLIKTVLQDIRAEHPSNLDRDELRRTRTGLLTAVMEMTDAQNSIVSGDLKSKAIGSEGRNLDIPVMKKGNVTIKNVRSCTIAGGDSESDLVRVTWKTIVADILMIPERYENNQVGYQADLTRKIADVVEAFKIEMENDLDTAFDANKSQVYGSGIIGTSALAEIASLQIDAPAGSAGDVVVTLDGVSTNVAVALNDTAIQVADKIRATSFSGWTTGGTLGTDTVTFTSTTTGAKINTTYSANGTGSTGTVTTTQEGNAGVGSYSLTGSAIQVKPTDIEFFFNDLDAINMADDFNEPEIKIVGNHTLMPHVRRYVNQGGANATNTQFQFAGKDFTFTNRITNGAGVNATGYFMPDGSVGMLTRVDTASRMGLNAGDGTDWFEDILPGLPFPVGIQFKSKCDDKSTLETAGSAYLEATLVEQMQISFDFAVVVPYNTDIASQPSSIRKFEFVPAV